MIEAGDVIDVLRLQDKIIFKTAINICIQGENEIEYLLNVLKREG